LHAPLQSQTQLYSEAPVIFENGVRKSTQLTVHFKYPVLDLRRGTRRAAITDIASQFPQLVTYFSALRNRYGDITFIKQIPNAVWGDVWRTNFNTGQLVRIHDMSQLFAMAFTHFVPIDSIIAELQKMDEVQYAHQPIQTISFITHNADEPQPKRLTGENRANREDNDWEFLFSFLSSVCSVFSVLKIFAFFAKISLVTD
jgi:hypothetical protein